MQKPKVIVLRTAGTNCDKETAFAFKEAGASVESVHINRLINRKKSLDNYDILALPGGFTYGDDVAAGKILANELRFKLSADLKKFIKDGKLIIGICNGFQILVKAGILPGNESFSQEATLTLNDSAKFEDRWIYLRRVSSIEYRVSRKAVDSKCIWTKDLPEIIYLPVAHGEGKFVVNNDSVLQRLKQNNQIVFKYCDEKGKNAGYPFNPNGSVEDIAGICDESGRILGLMPHPERHFLKEQHPHWTRNAKNKFGDGFQIFKNGVEYARKHL
ncbi:MAG: phosphoribosylformylglycinamidine synthase I [Candidatus Omnitrophota bacterium]|nr:phosphoribosylformylglycinamidine synthase I [Candidatus Omnitrophota bacterium]